MDEARWERIKELFAAALELEPAAREAFVDEVCGEDRDLREGLDGLLAAHADSDAFLELPSQAELLTGGSATLPRFERVGRYRLESVLSIGGMGTVYRATQENPHRTVALKMMREGLSSRSALRRFQYESEILARLTHPNIAQVIESGTHRAEGGEAGAGWPYFVMEFVPDAVTITEYARDRGLGVTERLRLFLRVCDAVHHGHQKGIIHRDLKPANLLVDPSGQVKVIDFGVARATDTDIRLTTAHTGVGQLVGTVQYMSPEQCRADPDELDIRSDVYALGVVLYELLCGALPYEVERVPLLEAARVIGEAEPRRPSTINRALRGDVETIVLEALEKDPDDRYETVAHLAADIRRHLEGEVILARPVGPVTRAFKYVARSPVLRTGLVVGAGAIAALVGYVLFVSLPQIRYERNEAETGRTAALAAEREAVAALLEADRQREAAQEAESEARRKADVNEAISAFVKDMFAAPVAAGGGRAVKVADVLDRAAASLGVTYEGEPEIEAELRDTLGWTYMNLGLYREARTQFETAVGLRTELQGARHPATLESRLALCSVRNNLGAFSRSEAELRELIEAFRETRGPDDEHTLHASHLRASALTGLGRYAEAVELARALVVESTRALGEDHAETAEQLRALAQALEFAGELGEAEAVYREIVARDPRLADPSAQPPEVVVAAQGGLATLLMRRDALDEAEPLLAELVEHSRRERGDEHPVTLNALNNFGTLLGKRGKMREARAVFEDVLELRLRLLGPDHTYTLGARMNLAKTLLHLRELGAAEAMLREVVAARKRVSGPDHPHTLMAERSLARVLVDRGEYAEAEALCRESLAALSRTLGERHPDTLHTVSLLGSVLIDLGRADEAEPLLVRALEIARESLPPGHTQASRLVLELGLCELALGRHEEAEAHLLESHALYVASVGAGHPDTQIVVRALSRLYTALGDLDEAAAWNARRTHGG